MLSVVEQNCIESSLMVGPDYLNWDYFDPPYQHRVQIQKQHIKKKKGSFFGQLTSVGVIIDIL